MLIIACMDGSSASLRRTHLRTYMSDVVESAVMHHTKDYRFKSKKGGLIFNGKWSMRRFILKHNTVQNTLLAVGKSYGAKNINDLITDLKPMLNYDMVFLFLVDACWIGAHRAGYEIKVPRVDRVINFYQRNNPALVGAKTIPATKYETDLTTHGVDHWSITGSLPIAASLRSCVKQLIGGHV